MKRFYRMIALNGIKEIMQFSNVKEWSFPFFKNGFSFYWNPWKVESKQNEKTVLWRRTVFSSTMFEVNQTNSTIINLKLKT